MNSSLFGNCIFLLQSLPWDKISWISYRHDLHPFSWKPKGIAKLPFHHWMIGMWSPDTFSSKPKGISELVDLWYPDTSCLGLLIAAPNMILLQLLCSSRIFEFEGFWIHLKRLCQPSLHTCQKSFLFTFSIYDFFGSEFFFYRKPL